MGNQKALTRTVSVCVVVTFFAAAAVLFGRPAAASFHLMKIVEVYQSGQQNSEFIELQMYAAGQNGVAGKTVKVYGPDGAETGSFTFPGNVSNGANQARILLATEAAEFEFGVQADFRITEAMQFFGGAVCFEDIDCVAWGEYAGDTSRTGSPFSPENGLEANRSMTRDTSGGSNASRLDADDDTDDSAADFEHATPTPTSNGSSEPTPSESGSDSPSPTDGGTSSPSPTQTPVGDPPNADATITRPGWNETYRAGRLTTFKGTARHETGEDFRVFIALRQKLKSGSCKWLTGAGRFRRDGCRSRADHLLRARGSGRWRYELDDRLASSRRSRIAKYTLYAEAECGCSPFQGLRDRHPFEIR